MPAIPYHATATRPAWSALPAAVRAAIERELGAVVVAAASAGGGFTAGFAARVEGADGRRSFVKAESTERNQVIADSYRREAVINAALPAAVPAPRVRWQVEVAGWVVLGFDDVAGRMAAWPGDLDAISTLVSRVAEALDPAPPGIELHTLAADAGAELTVWRDAVGGGPVPAADGWAAAHLELLAGLESRWEAAVAGTAMIHGDLRPDNVLIDGDGAAWLCDWNWPSLAAPWFDLALALPTAYVAGIDADAVLARHPVGGAADPDAVNAVLAAFAGMFLSRCAEPPPPSGSPWLRAHQRHYGVATLAWLRSRL
jgi:hypothetical protein